MVESAKQHCYNCQSYSVCRYWWGASEAIMRLPVADRVSPASELAKFLGPLCTAWRKEAPDASDS